MTKKRPDPIARVTLNIFSGLRNPSWDLSVKQYAEYKRRLAKLPPVQDADEPAEAWSFYAGFTIESRDRVITCFGGEVVEEKGDARTLIRRDPDHQLERWMFEETTPVEQRRLLGEASFAMLSAPRNERFTMTGIEGDMNGGLECTSAPRYPGFTGVWRTRRRRNNCYNYANDEPSAGLLSAMPGALNVISHDNASLKAAVESDGLIFVGKALPVACPVNPDAHFVAICLREQFGQFHDFHCLRLDEEGRWSHKDGNGAVRNKDNANRLIKDLRTARWKLQTDLVGFFLSIDGQRNIRA